jgi:hypothetical protein
MSNEEPAEGADGYESAVSSAACDTNREVEIVRPHWVFHHAAGIFSIDMHPDGTRFATGGDDQLIKIWATEPVLDDIVEKTFVNPPTDLKQSILPTNFQPKPANTSETDANDAKHQVASSETKENIINAQNDKETHPDEEEETFFPKLLCTLHHAERNVFSVRFNHTGNFLASGHGSLRNEEVQSGETKRNTGQVIIWYFFIF